MMATMFRDFSFDPVSPPAYSMYEAERAAMNVSPSSTAPDSLQRFHRPITPPCTMGDLAVQLKQQTLRIATADSFSRPPSPPADDCTEQPHQPRPMYSRVSASLLRMQRQSNSRMQCSASHVRDISKLVQMIEEQEQCTITDTKSRTCSESSTSTSSSSDDEGVDMDYNTVSQNMEAFIGTPAWRSGDRRDSCIRVIKPVRMRKRSNPNGVSKRRSL